MPTNDFKWFGIAGGANVESQAGYIADPQTADGYTAGIVASSPKLNKSWRQGTMASALVGYLINTVLGVDCLDNGVLATIYTNFVAALQQLIGNPAGSFLYHAADTPPPGYLVADGSSVLRATYPNLFAAIGTTWGSVDGTHFNLPDARGYFLRAWDDGAGIDPARAFATIQADGFASHIHDVPYQGNNSGDAGPGHGGSGFSTNSPSQTDPTGGTETRPKNIAVLVCIKY